MSDLSPSPLRHPRRILIRGVNWLGDAVMTTPALQRLREALPEAHLTLLTPEKLADLWQRQPGLDALIAFSQGESVWSVARKLRAETFQTALVLPNSHRSALEVWLARIPQRVGYARSWRSWLLTQPLAPRPGQVRMPKRSAAEVRRLVELGSSGLRNPDPPLWQEDERGIEARPLTPSLSPSEGERVGVRGTVHFDGTGILSWPAPASPAHQIHDYLHLAAALGASPEPLPPKLEITDAEVRQAEAELLSHWRNQMPDSAPGAPSRLPPLLLGLCPGAEYGPAKRWPAENFATVARQVFWKAGNCLWLAFGGPGDWQLCHDVACRAGGGVVNLAGKTSLRQLMALLKRCRLLLTNDTGPMHLAAALGTPVVVPFGSTSPELTGPGLPGDPRHRLLQSAAPCSPCFRRTCPIDFRCMTGLTPDRVFESVTQLLSLK